MLLLLRFECKQKNSSNLFRIRIFLQNGQNVYPFSDQNGAKNPTRWGGTYLYSFYRYHVPWVVPPPLPRAKPKEKKGKKHKCSECCEIWLDILTVVVCLCQAAKRNLLRLHSMPEEIYRSCEAETDVLSLIIDYMCEGKRHHIALPSFLRSLNYESILDANETNVTPFSSLYSHYKMIHDTHWLWKDFFNPQPSWAAWVSSSALNNIYLKLGTVQYRNVPWI